MGEYLSLHSRSTVWSCCNSAPFSTLKCYRGCPMEWGNQGWATRRCCCCDVMCGWVWVGAYGDGVQSRAYETVCHSIALTGSGGSHSHILVSLLPRSNQLGWLTNYSFVNVGLESLSKASVCQSCASWVSLDRNKGKDPKIGIIISIINLAALIICTTKISLSQDDNKKTRGSDTKQKWVGISAHPWSNYGFGEIP